MIIEKLWNCPSFTAPVKVLMIWREYVDNLYESKDGPDDEELQFQEESDVWVANTV